MNSSTPARPNQNPEDKSAERTAQEHAAEQIEHAKDRHPPRTAVPPKKDESGS